MRVDGRHESSGVAHITLAPGRVSSGTLGR